MATLAEQRDELIATIARNESRVTHGTKTTEYGLGDAKEALKILDEEIAKAGASSGSRTVRQLRVVTDKGLGC